jgi:hypothetical protein
MLSQAALKSWPNPVLRAWRKGCPREYPVKADLLLRLMRRRFDNVPPAVEQRVLMAEADDLDQWGEAILDAGTIEDVFSPPRH